MSRAVPKLISMAVNISAVVFSVIFLIAAFTACGEWDSLVKDLEDKFDILNIDLGSSWFLMLFAGILAVFLGIGCLATNFVKKEEAEQGLAKSQT